MSLVNVWITPAKAMVVVDTEARDELDGTYFEMSKMLTLPHANVVVAGRGQNIFMNVLFSYLHNNGATTFDAFEDAMPLLLASTTAGLKASSYVFAGPIEEQEVALVGYSEARGGMACVVWQSKDASGFHPQEVDDIYLSPWDSAAWGQGGLQASTPHHAQVISQEQVARSLDRHPEAAIGGRLLLAEVTRDDCRVSTLARVTTRT